MSQQTLHQTGYLRERQVRQLIPVAHSTLWLWMKQGKFPRSFSLSPGITVWRASEVIGWINQQAEEHAQQNDTATYRAQRGNVTSATCAQAGQ